MIFDLDLDQPFHKLLWDFLVANSDDDPDTNPDWHPTVGRDPDQVIEDKFLDLSNQVGVYTFRNINTIGIVIKATSHDHLIPRKNREKDLCPEPDPDDPTDRPAWKQLYDQFPWFVGKASSLTSLMENNSGYGLPFVVVYAECGEAKGNGGRFGAPFGGMSNHRVVFYNCFNYNSDFMSTRYGIEFSANNWIDKYPTGEDWEPDEERPHEIPDGPFRLLLELVVQQIKVTAFIRSFEWHLEEHPETFLVKISEEDKGFTTTLIAILEKLHRQQMIIRGIQAQLSCCEDISLLDDEDALKMATGGGVGLKTLQYIYMIKEKMIINDYFLKIGYDARMLFSFWGNSTYFLELADQTIDEIPWDRPEPEEEDPDEEEDDEEEEP